MGGLPPFVVNGHALARMEQADQEEADLHPDVAAARRDPRLDHDGKAMIADSWGALAAAERARRLSDWGLFELKQSLKREEADTGFRLGDASFSA